MADEIIRLAAACDRRSQAPRPQCRGGWSDPPTDALYQVMCCLPSLQDRLGLAAVCRCWHAAVRTSLPWTLPKICLALPDGRFFAFQPGSSVLKPHHYSNHRHHPRSGRPGSYRGATCSQLLFLTNGVYSLVNPFTGRERLLPVPSGIHIHIHEEEIAGGEPEEDYYYSEEMPVRKLVVCPSGLVAAIVGHEYSAKIALCAPEWAAWSWSLSAHDPWRWYADMAFFGGKLYALTHDEDLLALEVGYDDRSGRPRISSVERVINGGGGSRYALGEYIRARYLVVRPRDGGLLMVCKIMLEYDSTTHEFAVFHADLRSSRWVEVNTLGGDEALFVGRLCSRAVRADRHGVRGDQIFFLDDSAGTERPGRLSLDGDGLASVYDMKDGTVSELLPMHSHGNREVPLTWLFREDADAEE